MKANGPHRDAHGETLYRQKQHRLDLFDKANRDESSCCGNPGKLLVDPGRRPFGEHVQPIESDRSGVRSQSKPDNHG
jgi:hypothetical protein